MNIVEIYNKFPTEEDCIKHLERVRWNGEVRCPYCNSVRCSQLPKENRHHCNRCKSSFSVTVGTIFHRTHLSLQKWFLALSLMLNAKKGLSSRQLSRNLGVNKNTGWRISMQIRKAMSQTGDRELLTGIVEADETYIGGKPRKGSGKKNKRGRGTKKIPVVGMVERNGKVKADVVKNNKLNSKTLSSLVRKNVDTSNATLITDEFRGYFGIKKFMDHKTVNHKIWYVDGDTHTNTIESFWAILKRGMVGQFHKVSLRYLHRYIDEFTYRYNHRKNSNLFHDTLGKAVRVR